MCSGHDSGEGFRASAGLRCKQHAQVFCSASARHRVMLVAPVLSHNKRHDSLSFSCRRQMKHPGLSLSSRTSTMSRIEVQESTEEPWNVAWKDVQYTICLENDLGGSVPVAGAVGKQRSLQHESCCCPCPCIDCEQMEPVRGMPGMRIPDIKCMQAGISTLLGHPATLAESAVVNGLYHHTCSPHVKRDVASELSASHPQNKSRSVA